MDQYLSEEELAAVNQLLTWQAQVRELGYRTTVDLKCEAEGGAWRLVAWVYSGDLTSCKRFAADDGSSECFFTAVGKLLAVLPAPGVATLFEQVPEPDTEPSNPRPSSIPPVLAPMPAEAVTPLEELIQ